MARVLSTLVNVKEIPVGKRAVIDPSGSRISVMFPSGMYVPNVDMAEMLYGLPANSISRPPAKFQIQQGNISVMNK